MRVSWTQAVCMPCWFKMNPGRQPTQLTMRGEETCCYCGETTRAGIYVRVDPKTVPYANRER